MDLFVQNVSGRKVTLKRGRIELEQVDVIACVVDTNLNPESSGSAASSLFSSGGETLVRECREKFPSGIKYGTVISIHGLGSLRGQQIYFASLPLEVLFGKKDQQLNSECQIKYLRNTVRLILNKALQDEVKSIALPAIGTGKMNMTAETVASIMRDCVEDLPEGSLTDIRLVLQGKVGYKGETLLHWAIVFENLPVVQYLLSHGAKITESHLRSAIVENYPGIVQALILAGAEVTDNMVRKSEQKISEIIAGDRYYYDHKRIAEAYKVHEVVTRQTAQDVLSIMERDKTAIEQMDERKYYRKDITKQELHDKYKKAIEYYIEVMLYQLSELFADGTEKDYFVRVNFFGFTGAGKTSIMLQMFLQKFDAVKMTSNDGIDIFSGYCIIDLATGKWRKYDKKEYDGLLKRMQTITTGKEKQTQSDHEKPEQKKITRSSATKEPFKRSDRQDTRTKVDERPKPELQSIRQETTNSYPEQENIRKNGATGAIFDEGIKQHTGTKKVKNRAGDLTRVEIIYDTNKMHHGKVDQHLKARFQQNPIQATGASGRIEETAYVNGFDYAGQGTHYSLQQLFFSKRGINLILLDASRDFDDPIHDEDERHTGAHLTGNSKDFFIYWCNLLRYFLPRSNTTKIIIVFTHKDLVQDQREMQNKKCDIQVIIDEIEMTEMFYKDIFCLNANDPGDTELPQLRHVILELSKAADDWGKRMPSRWLLLEFKLMTKKSEGIQFMTLAEVEELNEKSSPRLESRDELLLFLEVHHDIGTLIHFADEGLQNVVVLDAQWLVDCFKSIIKARQFRDSKYQKQWKRLHENGIVDKEFIMKIWRDLKKERFFEFREELILFMKEMGLISSPRSYNHEGQHEQHSYFVLPSMLQKAPKDFLIKYQREADYSNNALSFEFEYSFLPTATVHRLLATCIMQYGDSVKYKTTVYCDAAVFKVYKHHYLTLKITSSSIIANILVFGKRYADVGVSQGVRGFLNDTLTCIIKAQKTTTKYELSAACGKEIACWLKWGDLMEESTIVCDRHGNDPPHTVSCDEIIKQWVVMEVMRTESQSSRRNIQGNISSDDKPTPVLLGRISRRIPGKGIHRLFLNLGLEEDFISSQDLHKPVTLLLLLEWRRQPNATLATLTRALREQQGYTLDIEQLQSLSSDWIADFPRKRLDKMVSKANDFEIDYICFMTGTKYIELAFELGFIKEEVDAFKMDHKYCHKITRKIIKSWTRKQRHLATWRVLGDVLYEIKSDPEFIKDICK